MFETRQRQPGVQEAIHFHQETIQTAYVDSGKHLLRFLIKFFNIFFVQEDINNQQYSECVTKADSALSSVEANSRMARDISSKLCLCLSKSDGLRGIKVCSALLELEAQSSDFLANRAEAYILNEQYEEGGRG